MSPKEFQPQITTLAQKLSQDFPDIVFFREGPIEKDTKINLIWKNDAYYIKAFTAEWAEDWVKELEHINLLNTFSQETWSCFSWPEIVKSMTDDTVYFLMKNIEQSWKKMIDFSTLSVEELISLYGLYRKEFDAFEKFLKANHHIHSEQWWALIWDQKKMVEKKQRQQTQEWIAQWDTTVKWIVDCDTDTLLTTFKALQKQVKQYDIEYAFGGFRSWHVFGDWHRYQLVDFDNVWYKIIWTELLWVIRSSLLLPVEEYSSYSEWRENFEKWYVVLTKTVNNKDQARLQLFQKLLWTIFFDFGHLMITTDSNRDKIKKKWLVPEENAKKGIEWNYQLLKELFEKDFLLKKT